jgi:UDP-N-acetylmuramoyl-L-alanyl-D-glutamate--2,6-diaminopimelate ligase
MKLNELIANFAETSLDIEVLGITINSNQVKVNEVFFALAGENQHGLHYAAQALKQGACAIIYDPDSDDEDLAGKLKNIEIIKIEKLAFKLGEIAARFYNYPAKKLDIIGITGTNGKTSCSQFLAQMQPKSVVIGTLGWGEWGNLKETQNTTPNALVLQSILADCVNQKKEQATLEVSSHGLALGRVNGVEFKGAVFTNLTQDHLDFHGSMDAYFQTKLSFFKRPELEFVVINLDDAYGVQIIKELSENVVLWTFSRMGKKIKNEQGILAENIRLMSTGFSFDVCYREYKLTVCCHFYGLFNVENILAVITTLLATGESLENAVKKASALKDISGRMQRFGGNGKPQIFVDYAHTPDALTKTLSALKQHHHQQISLVFGCGGDRDKGKRMQMGQIACYQADKIIITNDNPRHESSDAIIGDILLGCDANKVTVINDRKQAITMAIMQASQDDCILIAGKGHEDYQEIEGVKYPFSDQAIVKNVLPQWKAS